jgi:hypothetical protein
MAQAESASVSQIRPVQELESIVEGKIALVDQPENSDYTFYEFSLPSRDEYSMPAVIQVSQPNSQRPFGRKGDVLRIRVAIGGYPRTSNGRRFITNTLNFIEVL